MTKIKAKNRKRAPAVAVQRMVGRLYPAIMAAQEVPLLWKHHDYKMACCDCHLVHRLRFTVKGGTLFIQGWRDNRATAQLRRKRGKTPNQ